MKYGHETIKLKILHIHRQKSVEVSSFIKTKRKEKSIKFIYKFIFWGNYSDKSLLIVPNAFFRIRFTSLRERILEISLNNIRLIQ